MKMCFANKKVLSPADLLSPTPARLRPVLAPGPDRLVRGTPLPGGWPDGFSPVWRARRPAVGTLTLGGTGRKTAGRPGAISPVFRGSP